MVSIVIILFSVEEKPIGQALFDMHSARSRGFPFNIRRSRRITVNIDKPSDSDLVSRVKDIIKKMIAYQPADRISIREVIMRLSDMRDYLLSGNILLAMKERSVWAKVGSEWKHQRDLLPERHHPNFICFCTLPDGIVAVGGEWRDNVSPMCHHFSVYTFSWRRLPNMPTARCSVSAVMLGNVLMVLGGWDERKYKLDICEKFHMVDGVWSSAATMIEPLRRPLVAAARNKIYIVPRGTSIAPGTKIQQYNPVVDTFSRASQLPQHVQNTLCACLVAADEKLYLLGGEQRLAIQYSPTADQWTQLLSQPTARYGKWGCYGVVHDDKLLLCGGETESNDNILVEEFDISTQQWKTTDVKLPFGFIFFQSHVASINV